MAKSTTVERKNIKTKVGWSPFEGITFPGYLEATVIRGKPFLN
jgi:dihydroorotase-like cyclic amidohydrolase